MRGWLLRCAVAAAIALLFLVGLEGAFRLAARRSSPVGRIGPKPQGVFRILAFGGSTTAGVPVEAYGFAAQLEAGLRRLAPQRPVEVVNLARAGASSREVRDRVLQSGSAAADLLVVLSAHNEFLARPSGVPDLRRSLVDAAQQLQSVRSLATALRAARAAHSGARWPELPLRHVPYARAEPWFRGRLEDFESNLAEIANFASTEQIPLFLLTAPSNLSDWPPVYRGIASSRGDPGYERDVANVRRALAQGRLAEARRAIAASDARRGEDAMFVYLRGRLHRRRGEAALARAAFVRARDLDPYPWRAPSDFNRALRALGGTPGVRVVDIERAFEAAAEDGLVGFELIADNCHPTLRGHALIASEIARGMAEQGLHLPSHTRLPDAASWLRRYREELARRGDADELRLAFLLRSAIYVMKTPFLDFEAARRYLAQAARLAPDDWRVQANLAIAALLGGDAQAGRSALERARSLRGRPFGLDDREWAPYLKAALDHAGIEPGGYLAAGRSG